MENKISTSNITKNNIKQIEGYGDLKSTEYLKFLLEKIMNQYIQNGHKIKVEEIEHLVSHKIEIIYKYFKCRNKKGLNDLLEKAYEKGVDSINFDFKTKKHVRGKVYTKEELIEKMRKKSEKLNKCPSYNDMLNETPSVSVYIRVFGSWLEALREAGFDINSREGISKTPKINKLGVAKKDKIKEVKESLKGKYIEKQQRLNMSDVTEATTHTPVYIYISYYLLVI